MKKMPPEPRGIRTADCRAKMMNGISTKILRSALAVSLAGWLVHAPAQTARPEQAEKVSFPSVVCKQDPTVCEKMTGTGYLFARPGQKKVVLISHGSQGVDSRMYDYVDALQREGFAAMVLDHWTPRGIGVTHDDYRAAGLLGGNELNMNFDSHLAADWLRTERGFDKIGSIGESQGGASAIWLQRKWFHELIERNVKRLYGRDFKVQPLDAVVSLYAYCGIRNARRDAFVDKPILFIVGEVDDETPPRYCERMVEWMNARGGRAQIIVLKGEGHSFDAPYQRHRAFGPQYANCDILIDERGVTNENTGETTPGENTRPAMESCKRNGYHTGSWKDRFIAVPHWIAFFRQNL
jgi:dienelactone hydrolase